jgi:four helix bundle protein
MGFVRFEELRVFRLAERLADEIWDVVKNWNHFEKDTVGKQLVGSADSVGANIAEGAGRGTQADNKRFVRIARGSLHETRYWLRRAYKRSLFDDTKISVVKDILDELAPSLNAYLNSIGNTKHQTQKTKHKKLNTKHQTPNTT